MRTWSSLMRRMLCLTPWSKSGQPNLEEKQTALKITPVLEDLRLLETKKWLPESMTTLWLTDNYQAHSHYHPSVLHTLTTELAMRESASEMDPQTPDWCPKVHLIQHLLWQFALIWSWSRWLSGQICDYGWHMGPPLYAWNKTTVKAMETLWLTPTKEGHGCPVGKESHGVFFFFFWCWWSFIVAFSSEGSYSK